MMFLDSNGCKTERTKRIQISLDEREVLYKNKTQTKFRTWKDKEIQAVVSMCCYVLLPVYCSRDFRVDLYASHRRISCSILHT